MRPSKIDQMPAIAREAIEQALLEANFSGYVELAERLKRMGKGVSKSSLHRYAKKVREFQARAKYEAEVMANLGTDAAFLVRWARSDPKAAERLVKRLRAQQIPPE